MTSAADKSVGPSETIASKVVDAAIDSAQLNAPDDFEGGPCFHPQVIARCQAGWCQIPAGCFVMGSPETEWGHPPQEQRVAVTLTHPFRIQQHEVTQSEWISAGFVNPSGSVVNSRGVRLGDCTDDPDCPVGNVTWYEAVSYANLRSEREGLPTCYHPIDCVGEAGKPPVGMQCRSFSLGTASIYECAGYRLPTDAEWEYAARAGTRTAYYAGDITTREEIGVCAHEPALDAIAWYCFNGNNSSHPVGKLAPNDWGLYDMLGNVVEWSHDSAGHLPGAEAIVNLDWTVGGGQARDTRGGGFFGWPSLCRAASRTGSSAGARAPGIGFRLVQTMRAQ